jgi:3-oxoacyl-[acyl-carrier protein] reductase
MELDLDGKVAFVTGATRGIGRAIALRLADEGCHVGLCARDADAVATAAAELRALGVDAHGVAADVTDEASLTAAVDEVAAALHGLDIVVANAGGAAGGPALEDTSADDWQRTLALSVTHPAVLMRAALPHLRARGGGAAVLIASISGMKPQPRAQYAAAKAAEIHLAHTLARELGPDGIRVNAVAPGTFSTEMQQAMVASGRASLDRYLERIPMKRIGRPEELADAVFFLASPQASYISGVVLHVDGGWAGGGLPATA